MAEACFGLMGWRVSHSLRVYSQILTVGVQFGKAKSEDL